MNDRNPEPTIPLRNAGKKARKLAVQFLISFLSRVAVALVMDE